MKTLPARPHVNRWLLPLSWLYGLGVRTRNLMFDAGILREEAFDVPVICVGNLAVGGTGKTPHAEYLIRLLARQGRRVALLSRGYRRERHGWAMASERSTAGDIGDEPLQIYRKYPDTIVAADADRRDGIRHLLALLSPPDCIVLDDAFQHRYVRAGLNILLTDYRRLYTDDALLPAGRLREPAQGVRRAHIVIVTKCPDDLSAESCEEIRRKLRLHAGQHVFFTRMVYGKPYALFPKEASANDLTEEAETSRRLSVTSRRIEKTSRLTDTTSRRPVDAVPPSGRLLVVAGIAHPAPFVRHARTLCPDVVPLTFPDHHAFSPADLRRIDEELAKLGGTRGHILTTEKDAARLLHATGLTSAVRAALRVQPIEVEFLHQGATAFDDIVCHYAGKPKENI